MLIMKHSGLCWVLPENKLAYLHIPRCGTTSIRDSANYKIGNINFIPPDFHVFTILRNPYDRFYSAYEEALKRFDLAADILPVPETEADVLKAIEMLQGGLYEPHFIPQYRFLTDKNGQVYPITQYIWFGDHMQKEIIDLYGQFTVNFNPFQHHNKSGNGIKDAVREIVKQSPVLQGKLREIYNGDELLIKRAFDKPDMDFGM